MSQSTARVLALLEVLQAQPGLTAPELAQRLGVDERTVRRHVASLVDLGLPVQAERGRYGGYRLLPGYRLPPLMLSDEEAVAVVLGLITSGRGTGTAARESALGKIERVLPAALRERVRAVRETLGFTRPASASDTPPAAGHVLTLGEAVRDGRRVTVTYRSWRGEDSERDFDPYGVVVHAGKWYAAGHDHASGELRTLRVDRIAGIAPTGARFAPPAGFDAVAHVVGSLAAVPYRHEVEVVLHTTLAEARARIPPTVGATHATPQGAVRLTCRAERLDGMARMLVGLGWPFEVRRPAELREEIRALGRRLLNNADVPTYIKSVTFDCADPLLVARFWAAALGTDMDEDSTGERAFVEAAGWGGPNMWFVRVPEPKTAKNRMHFDLRAPGAVADEVARLEGLGARVRHVRDDLTVMLDPEGNEFCVE
ncbi:WYL domain-containing protein [Dactylosporangium sp. AC04546]|uniref:VOC family protein n=1 Tax=Dactylosporangium sp. AC04546 TaxID=2862460 RepID=UPI0027DFA545|nr:WYL domain-containing protein [Dactylosporangium sp. AC04546]WVK87514.1 WYL domain-containing protein [Dactylosporangium sp. AC04546]